MIIIVGFVVAFVMVLVFSNRRTRHCRWRAQGKMTDGLSTSYKCMYCGATTVAATGKGPDICLRARRDTGI